MGRLTCASLVALLLFGCTSGEEPHPGAFPTPKPQFSAEDPDPPRRFVDVPDPPANWGPVVRESSTSQRAARDLSNEFALVLGSPTRCVRDFQSATPTTIRIPVSATVRPTGLIIQPSVSGAGLSVAALRCIEELASVVKLMPLDEPTSQPVSTVIEIDYRPPVVVEEPMAPEPDLKGVTAPLPKKPTVAASGRAIQTPTSRPIDARDSVDPTGPTGRSVTGPKPRPIDGYEVDQNAQQWR